MTSLTTDQITNLERVQRHSDDMGKTAMELREKLSKSQDEKNLWHRRFEELETKEQSLFAQMEETISHRTDVLNENMSRQATDSEQRIKELIKINEVPPNSPHSPLSSSSVHTY